MGCEYFIRMSQLPVDGFHNKDFIENYNEVSDEGYFLGVHIQYSENLHDPHNDLLFFLKEWKLKK